MKKEFQMFKKRMLTVCCFSIILSLYGCNDDNDSDHVRNDLDKDTNPYSCSATANDGSNVVVGSDQAGDPAFPEPASGYRTGLKVKYSDKYMVVANTPLATIILNPKLAKTFFIFFPFFINLI